VQIFEDEHEGPLFGERLEKPTPGGERLAAPVSGRRLLGVEPGQGSQMSFDPARIGRLGDVPLHRLSQPRACLLWAVRLEDPRLGLDHLRKRPEGDAVAIGERATTTPEDDAEVTALDRLEELENEPALADSRHADERDELRPALPRHAAERLS